VALVELVKLVALVPLAERLLLRSRPARWQLRLAAPRPPGH